MYQFIFSILELVGYNIGVINSPADYMQTWCNKTLHDLYGVVLTFDELQTLWSAVVSIFLIGGCLGSLVGSWLADRFGRKKSLLCCCILFSVGAILFNLCRMFASVEILIIGRLIVGLAAGLTTSIVPMYLAEVAPLEIQGTLAVLNSLGSFVCRLMANWLLAASTLFFYCASTTV